MSDDIEIDNWFELLRLYFWESRNLQLPEVRRKLESEMGASELQRRLAFLKDYLGGKYDRNGFEALTLFRSRSGRN